MIHANLRKKTQHLYRHAFLNIEGSIAEGLFSPTFTLINPLPSALPFGGRYEGFDGLRHYMSGLNRHIRIETFQVQQIFIDGQTAVVLGHEESQIITSGGRYSMDWIHVLIFDDEGRYTSLREYNDIARMLDAMTPSATHQTERPAHAS